MARAPAADTKKRSTIARSLLEIQKRLEPDLLKIDAFKEELRGLCEKAGESFTEEIAGLGSVEVKAGGEAEFKGILPELVATKFLKLPATRRKILIEQGLVVETEQWSKDRKPSVTVRL